MNTKRANHLISFIVTLTVQHVLAGHQTSQIYSNIKPRLYEFLNYDRSGAKLADLSINSKNAPRVNRDELDLNQIVNPLTNRSQLRSNRDAVELIVDYEIKSRLDESLDYQAQGNMNQASKPPRAQNEQNFRILSTKTTTSRPTYDQIPRPLLRQLDWPSDIEWIDKSLEQ